MGTLLSVCPASKALDTLGTAGSETQHARYSQHMPLPAAFGDN